jgi:FtsH-binding integral membrane protein
VSNRNNGKEISMRTRYLSYLTLGVVAAFLVVATFAFDAPTVVALAFGLGIAMLVVSTGLAVRYRNDVPSLVIGAAIAAVSAWTILASLVFSNGTVDDLTFASALAISALSVLGLTAHELGAERVVHSLEVRERRSESAPGGQPIAA